MTGTIRAPLEKVFAAATDYESIPKWSEFYTSAPVTRREGNTVYTEVETKVFGQSGRGTARCVETPMDRLEVFGEGMNTTSKATYTFERTPDRTGTKFVYVVDTELRGALATILGIFAKSKLESVARQGAKAFIAYVEES